jgi:hypothetical protein
MELLGTDVDWFEAGTCYSFLKGHVRAFGNAGKQPENYRFS